MSEQLPQTRHLKWHTVEESTDPRVEPHIKILFYTEGEGHIYT